MASGWDGSSEVARVGAGFMVRRGPRVLGSSGRGPIDQPGAGVPGRRVSRSRTVGACSASAVNEAVTARCSSRRRPVRGVAGRNRRGIFARPRSRRTNRCVRTAGVPGRRLRLARRRQTEGLQRPELPTKGAAPVLAARRTMPQRLRCLRVTIRFVVGSVLVGLACGRPERPNDGAIAFRLCQTAPPDG
jgi:hypothetical protein